MLVLDIENIAGIRSGRATISPGLNVVQASNFRGKSSLIAALQTVMGATGYHDDHPLTEGVDSGSVTLRTEDETYNVTVDRERGTNTLSGTPYLTDETDQLCARLFAFLGENNPIRAAVRNGDDITEFLQEPLDIKEIDRQISELRDERREVKKELTEVERAANNLPAVQADVTQLETELDELRERKDELEDAHQETEEADDLSDQLNDRRNALQDHKTQIRRTEDLLERHETQLDEKQAKLEELDEPEEAESLAELDEKKERVDALATKIDLFEDLQRANQNILDDADLDILTDVERTISGDEIECWVCGNTAPKEVMEERVERIGDRITELRNKKQELQTELKEHQKHKREAKKQQREYERLQRRIATLKDKIAEEKSNLEIYREKKEEVQEEVAELEKEVAEAEDEYNEELTEVKAEIRTKEQELERKRDHLADLEARKADLENLRETKEELSEEIEDLRREKTDTQYALRDEFDTAIDDIIDRYAPGFEEARFDIKTNKDGDVEKFELIIARDGRQTTVDALSEGEVELIGVAVALSGYRVYNVGERVPLILIDGISQLASEHLQRLTDYLEDTADILVTTAYPEAGGFDGQIISPEDWDVVSNELGSA